MGRWYHMFKNASSRWQIVDLRVSYVLHIYRSSINDCLPWFILRDATIHYESLPIVYPTIKRKCFAGQLDVFYFEDRAVPFKPIRTCDKSSHSCFRNIVSFARCQEPDNSALSAEPSGTWFPTHCIPTALITWVLCVMSCRMLLVISWKMMMLADVCHVIAVCADPQ